MSAVKQQNRITNSNQVEMKSISQVLPTSITTDKLQINQIICLPTAAQITNDQNPGHLN